MKLAIVTGGAKGIGLGITKKLDEMGYAIAILASSPKEAIAENIADIKECMYFQADISDRDAREKFIADVMDKYGRIDLLVNNTGVAPKERKNILEMTEESFDFVVGTNLRSVFFLTQSVAKIMKSQMSGKIINISSVSAYTSSVSRGEYCISKAGISMMTKLFADEMANYGVNVYEIRPGIIKTDMTKTVADKYDALIEGGLTPIKRWGYPEDIANAVSAIADDKFIFSTGEVFNVDGGFHLRRL